MPTNILRKLDSVTERQIASAEISAVTPRPAAGKVLELLGLHQGEEAEQRDANAEYFHGHFRERGFDGLLNYHSSHGARGVTSRGARAS